MHNAPELRSDQSLEDAVRALATTDQEGLPVLDPDGENVIGWLTHRRLLRAYHSHLERPGSGQPAINIGPESEI